MAKQYTYLIKPIGRGNYKTTRITVTSRISLGANIEIQGRVYRVLDIVDLKEG